MNQIITRNQDALRQLCRQYHVKKLEVFGSVTRDDFNTEKSDIDFLVEFNAIDSADYADNYFNLHSALQQLFKTPVELVVTSTIKNPYFLESIEVDRSFLYAAEILIGQTNKLREHFPDTSIFATSHPDNTVSNHIIEKLGLGL